MKKTKRSIWISIISLVLCFIMLIGTTYAWFTDSVTSAGNKIISGTLAIDLELLDRQSGEWSSLKQTSEPIFNYDNWEPGYTDIKVFKVENEGSLALKWAAKLYTEDELSILADVIDVYVRPSDTPIGYPEDRSLVGYTKVGNLRSFIDTFDETTHGTLNANESAYLGLALKMREEAGNAYRNLSLGGAFDIRIVANQHTFEPDSFGNTYDELASQNILARETKTLAEGESSIKFSIAANGSSIARIKVPADAIADPAKPVSVTIRSIDPKDTIDVGSGILAYAYDIDVTNLKENLSDTQLVEVVVAAPNALAAMNVYHNGTLISDAVYDDAAGTVTFKTAHFSPFAFSSVTYEVTTALELREKLQIDGATVKLASDIVIDLGSGGGLRDKTHAYVSANGTTVYYNGIHIGGKSVALDLNGHTITAVTDHLNTTGSIFYVTENGSLNILDSVGTGYIKAKNSMYIVWAPFAEPSYVDIYSGVFISDSYAGDLVATPGSSQYVENDNRAMIYAGTGGHVNVYGGYYLYNNTPNDTLDRNNGAFNCKDFHETAFPLIKLHGGVMLINNEYRQNPANTSTPNGSFDDYSIRLALGCYITEDRVSDPLVIDGVTYDGWYRVYSYKVTYMHDDEILGVEYVGDNTLPHPLRPVKEAHHAWINREGEEITQIEAGTLNDVFVYLDDVEKHFAYFVDKDGNLVERLEFTERDSQLPYEPEVPKVEGYNGYWEHYSIVGAAGSIVIEPYYTSDANFGELYDGGTVSALFDALSNGKTMIMTQELGAAQGNASQTTACYITETDADKDAALNLNGYALEYAFNNPSGKKWNIFYIHAGCRFDINSGFSAQSTIRMSATVKKAEATPSVFTLEAGSVLALGKGVVIEFQYTAGKNADMFIVDGMTEEQLLDKYHNLRLEHIEGDDMDTLKLTVLEDTIIEIPAK